MTHDSERPTGGVSRRKFLVTSGAIGAAGLAGCTGGGSDDTPTAEPQNNGDGGSESTPRPESESTPEPEQDKDLLTADGSSTVYPITNKAASHWNYNPPADDEEYWPHGEYDIDTKKNLAEYWAGKFDVESSGDSGPYRVSIGLSHSGVGCRKVMNGQVDIGDASAPVEAELPDADHDKFKNHVVGIDGMQVVVSKQIKDAGIDRITIEDLAKVYNGDISNWSDLGGPDSEIQCVGRVEGSGTRTIFHENVLDGKTKAPGVDVHKGENQQVASTVRNSDNAIGYVGIAFVGDGAEAIALKVGDTVYSQENENIANKEYPLNRDLHCYTYEGTDEYEAAFLNMIVSDFGQGLFVEPNGYITLNSKRQKEERDKLEQ
ncbi:MAG: PstS family phosphate ABC transporter substrate-binding protein [Halosimplex sp.]